MRIKIRDWEAHFERDRTKQWKSLQWVPVPNKRGFGYKIIMKQPDGPEIFGVWNAIIQEASKVDPRGDLSKYDVYQLSILLEISEKKIKRAIDFLSDNLDWIEVVGNLDSDVNGLDSDVNGLDVNGKRNSECCSILFSSIQFSSIYDLYPRKVGKTAAIKAIQKALQKIGYDELLEKTQQFAESVAGADMQYIPHPATWFNQERYNDPINHQVPYGKIKELNEYDVKDN